MTERSNRDYRVLIVEAELLCSTPDRVFNWLETRAGKSGGPFDPDGYDEELEKALIDRGDELIDIGLAKFGLKASVAQELFERFYKEPSEHNRALRLAVLSNVKLSKASIWGTPRCLFGSVGKGTETWLAQADALELAALFENPAISTAFLQDFLECKSSWQALSEELRLVALARLTRNPRIEASYSGIMDGYAEYSHGAVFSAGWKLAETMPTTSVWAYVLGWFYEKLRREDFSIDDPLTVAVRWFPDPVDNEEKEREANDNKLGYPGNHQRVRKCLGELALTKKSALLPQLLVHSDMALRASAYSAGQLNPEQIAAAYEKDGVLAVNTAVNNTLLWRCADVREALREISWRAVHDDKHSDLMAANMYNAVRERMQQAHADWFNDE